MPRTRSRDTSYGSYAVISAYSQTGTSEHGFPAAKTATDGAYILGAKHENITDTVTPGYHGIIRSGGVVNSPFRMYSKDTKWGRASSLQHQYARRNYSWCATHGVNHDLHTRWLGTYRPNGGSVSFDDCMSVAAREGKRQSVKSLAVTQAFANIDTSSMQALVTAAESRKTVDSMVGIMRRVYRIARNVRRLNVRALRKELSLNELQDRYMEARYAVRPLIYDAYGIADAFQKARGYERKTFRGYASDSGLITKAVVKTPLTYGLEADYTRSLKYDISCRAGVLCDCSISDLSVMGIDQLAESAWELVPFSFVVDWFANVGDWIAAQTPNAGVNRLASWATVKETFLLTMATSSARSVIPTLLGSNYYVVNANWGGVVDTVEELVLERFVDVSSAAMPQFDVRLDGFKLTDLGIMLRKSIS